MSYENVALEQDIDVLLKTTEYSYDLSNEDFQRECKRRGVLYVAGEPESRRWYVHAHYDYTKEEHNADKYFRYSAIGHKYTKKQLALQWEIILIGRAKLQDCWNKWMEEEE